MKNKKRVIYIIGSLRNKKVPIIANQLRKALPNAEIFDSWFSPGPRADDFWRDYCKGKGLSYKEALEDYSCTHIFEFDKYHIDRSTDVILIMKGGKSAFLELGYSLGKGKRGFILFDKVPERYDVMMRFANSVCFSFEDLVKELKKYEK